MCTTSKNGFGSAAKGPCGGCRQTVHFSVWLKRSFGEIFLFAGKKTLEHVTWEFDATRIHTSGESGRAGHSNATSISSCLFPNSVTFGPWMRNSRFSQRTLSGLYYRKLVTRDRQCFRLHFNCCSRMASRKIHVYFANLPCELGLYEKHFRSHIRS